MAKTKISEYSATAGSNTDINNINLAEGMAPSLVNNAIRQLMAQLKDFQVGTAGDNVTVGGNLAVTGTSAFTGAISAPMTAGTIDGVPIGGTTPAAGAFTTLAASGTTTLAGALVGAVTQAAFNTTTTTLNLGGAATAVNIGAATGTATVANTTLAAKAITASTTLAVTGTSTLTGAVTATAGVTGPLTSSNVTITGGSITGITDLAVADGGTGASTAQAALNNLLPSQASANTKYLQSDGTNASWDAIAVNTSDITGILAVANGGTATSSPSLVQGTNVTITGTWPNQTISAVGTGFGDVVGPASSTNNNLAAFDATTGKLLKEAATVTVLQGGTSLTTLTANNVILGNGTSAPLFVAPSTAGNVLTSAGGTWTSAAPVAGGVSYTAVKTANYTAANNDGVLTNTTGGAFTVTLPTSPSVGNIVVVVDSFSQWGTNNLTIDPTALIKIANNTAGDTLVCDITGITVTLVYTGATYGWNVSAQIGGNSGTVVTLTGTQTLTNKTLTAPVLTSPNITTALTLTSASGTSGDVLTSAGSGNAPTWTTLGSGALKLLSTVTASTSSTVDIETTFNSTYDAYLLVATGVTISATDNFYCRLKIGGSYLSTNTYQNHVHMMKGDDGAYTSIISGTAQINITGNLPTSTASHSIDFVMRVYTPSSTTFQKLIDWQGVTLNSTPKLMGFVGGGLNTGTDALTGVQFFTGGGTVNAGKFRLYGIANS